MKPTATEEKPKRTPSRRSKTQDEDTLNHLLNWKEEMEEEDEENAKELRSYFEGEEESDFKPNMNDLYEEALGEDRMRELENRHMEDLSWYEDDFEDPRWLDEEIF